MKKITREELDVFLRKHKLWLQNDPEGERADLRGANLRGADLYGANLYGANLYGADLRGADLRGADLRGADLYGADLYGADLRGADLHGANLRGADLYGADLRGADLYGADLRGADLYGADLHGANLYGAKDVNYPIACPEKGAFTAFKKANGYIVELLVPADAKRCSATSRKCRCNRAKVISITDLPGNETDLKSIPSYYDKSFVYRVGKYVEVKDFDDDRWNECSTGIHFFITRQEAVDYC